MTSALSLFDVADEVAVPAVRDLTLGAVSQPEMQDFASRYHYTRNGGVGLNWRWGLWNGAVLYGVIGYNQPTISTAASLFGPEHGQRVWHMSRLVLADEAPHNSESRLIGSSLRQIEREYPHVWAVITYAATDAGHIGTVYQATNALYIGTGRETTFYREPDGTRRPTYFDGRTITRADALARGWTVHRSGVKHRYLYLLGSRTQRRQSRAMLRFPVLPYPKGCDD